MKIRIELNSGLTQTLIISESLIRQAEQPMTIINDVLDPVLVKFVQRIDDTPPEGDEK
jgi:hypothetical protein